MEKKVVQLFFGLVLVLGLISFSPDKTNMELKPRIFANFNNYLLHSLDEKVYLQTDKPYYSSGENIWFKGYLASAATLEPNSLSRYVYVELINRMDSVVSRVKIHKDSTGFAGYIKLKPSLPSGDYNLRAYTYWMQNNAPEFFFHKTLFIGNSIDDHVNCKASYGVPANGEVLVNLQFLNENSQPIEGKKVQITQNWSGANKKKSTMTINSFGNATFYIPYNSTRHESRNLEVSIDEADLKYQNHIYLPDLSFDFDVQFFPESGVLLNNVLQIIAFKAIGTDGLSERVTGKVYSENGEEIATIDTQHSGMGKFLLTPMSGAHYYALIKSERGGEKRFNLPQGVDNGVSLHVGMLREKIVYEVTDRRNDTSQPLTMLVHSRGIPYLFMPLVKMSGQLQQDKLVPGIYVISILDSEGNILCERLFFSKYGDPLLVDMTSDKSSYGRRESVDLSFKIHSKAGGSPAGSYSVSITDGRLVRADSLNDNMVSYLLLSSDIKGHIENPLSYFVKDQVLQTSRLDLLMQTQAWRRYNTSDVTRHKFKIPEYYMEVGQTLSGRVLNFFGKPAKKCNVYALANNIFQATVTDSLGRFVVDGVQFQDSTVFVLKAKKPKSITDMEIIPDKDVFPLPHTFFTAPQAIQLTPPTEYFDQSKQKYYNDGGMRLIYLDEIKVFGEKKPEVQSNEFYSGSADTEMDAKEIEQFHSTSLFDVLATLPGVQVSGTEIQIRGSQNSPYLLIDGVPEMDLSELSYIQPAMVEKIEVFKGASAAIFGMNGGDGVIAISLKKGATIESVKSVSIAQVAPLGIQKPDQFYVPKYEVQKIKEDPKPDIRTTIYWNPSLVSDSTGMVKAKFYTADPQDDYSVVLEGITNEGEICHYEGLIKREDQ